MKNVIKLTKSIMPHRIIYTPRKIPKFSLNGDKFPTLKKLYLEDRAIQSNGQMRAEYPTSLGVENECLLDIHDFKAFLSSACNSKLIIVDPVVRSDE